MKVNHMNRLLLGLFVGTIAAGFGTSVLAQPQPKGKYEQSDNAKKDKQDEEKQTANRQRKPVDKNRADKTVPQAVSQLPRIEQAELKQETRMQAQAANRKQNDARFPVTPALKNRNQEARQRIAEAKEENRSRAPGKSKDQRRLPAQQQRVLIVQQQQRVTKYRQKVAQRQNASRQHGMQLQQQKRMAQYHYQQQYYERMRQQQIGYQNERFDYDNDPYFYTASSYRYNRGGRYFETNQYGANMLRQALNYGYQEGMRAGRADQQDHWRYSYRDSYIYEDANYGYNGYYVQQDDYNHYFRQGFQRGYEDGYYGRRKYGRNSNGSDSLLSAVLITVLGLQSIH